MQIAGVQKTSLIDFPNKISTVLFTIGCNMKCPYCHNKQISFDFVCPPQPMLMSDIFSLIQERMGFIDGISISGGEPTIQKDLLDFCVEVKKRFELLIKVDTNGSNPEVVNELIKNKLVNYFALDIKTSFKRYKESLGVDGTKILKSYNIIKDSGVDYELRMTCYPDFINTEVIDELLPYLNYRDRLFIQKCNNENTYDVGQLELFQNIFKEQGYGQTGLRF